MGECKQNEGQEEEERRIEVQEQQQEEKQYNGGKVPVNLNPQTLMSQPNFEPVFRIFFVPLLFLRPIPQLAGHQR